MTVIVLVSVMTTLSVAAVDDIRFAARRASNSADRDQAFWYALGGEHLGRAVLARSAALDSRRTTLNQPWARGQVRFPIPGGIIEGEIRDGDNCFNLNAILFQEPSSESASGENGRTLFERLLIALEFDPTDAEELAAKLADWVDADDQPQSGGAEDFRYLGLEPSYRTANAPLGEVEELRAIDGVDELIYQRLRPFVCARPTDRPTRLNINTLSVDQAELLVMALGEALNIDVARELLFERPNGGYASIDAFFDTAQLAGFPVTSAIRRRLSERTEFFDLTTRVFYENAYVELASTVTLGAQGEVTVTDRRLGSDR